MKTLLSGFPVTVKQPLQWGEMDMHNHVNNVWFFRYIENARIAYYEKIKKYEFENETGISFILASATCQYLSSLTYPDTVISGARMETIDKDSAILGYRLASSKNKRLAATAQTTIVSYNFTENKKVPFPNELKRRIIKLENKTF
ncbi:MAG: acyl-CoA thioesterase [Deltaproteobacteria bacterium]|nr:acyl-CoA thioesterase [Deltaproteobacteria bacterium]